jgi:hypothetical protein
MHFQGRIKMIKKTLTFLMALSIMPITYAAETVNFINVDGDTLYFSTEAAKLSVLPSCVAIQTNNQWAVSLDTQNGQSMYVLLLTAVANQLSVEITSAGDCKDAIGIERPKSVALRAE